MTTESSGDDTGRLSSKEQWLEYYDNLRSDEDLSRIDCNLSSFRKAQFDCIAEVVTSMLSSRDVVRLWSAGCGVDTVSVKLKRRFADRIRITLSDISPVCISLNRGIYDRLGLEAEFIVEDVFESQHAESFDIVTNTGLLEHFDTAWQRRLIERLMESLRPGGRYIALVPCSRARIYAHCMRRMKSMGTWPYGPEEPMSSLRPLGSSDFPLASESEVDCIEQFRFIPLAYPVVGRAFVPVNLLLRRIGRRFDRGLAKAFGGYCLIGEFQRT